MTTPATTTIDYAVPASVEQVLETASAVRARGITVEIVELLMKRLKRLMHSFRRALAS